MYAAWRSGEITFEEAVFLTRRVDLHVSLLWAPNWLKNAALWLFDWWNEPNMSVDISRKGGR